MMFATSWREPNWSSGGAMLSARMSPTLNETSETMKMDRTPMRIIWVLIAPVPMRLRLVQFLRNQRSASMTSSRTEPVWVTISIARAPTL